MPVRLCFLLLTLAAVALSQTSPSEWNDRGVAAAARGDHVEAERCYLQAVELWNSQGADYQFHRATAQLNLAQSYSAQGRRREAAQMFEEALAAFRRILGVRHERTLITMNLLGAVYLMLGDRAKAEPLFQEALPIEREILPKSVQTARTLGGLATIHLMDLNLDAALPQAEEALKIAIAAEGEISVDAALAYCTVAEIHRMALRNSRALPLYRKSRFIYEKLLGPEHPRVASLLSQEGLILMHDGKYASAEQNMTRSLEIIQKACPNCFYEQWVGLSNLGRLRLRQKRYAEADELLSQSLALQEKHAARPNPEMVATIQALAATLEKLRRFEDAKRMNKRAELLRAYR